MIKSTPHKKSITENAISSTNKTKISVSEIHQTVFTTHVGKRPLCYKYNIASYVDEPHIMTNYVLDYISLISR